jgi:radical SAM superfamily enzyme YgiQ (UPF0313 family)
MIRPERPVADSLKYAGEREIETYPVPRPGAPLAIAAYPNSYRIGMSNLGFHFVYSYLSRSGRFSVERGFFGGSPLNGSAEAIFFTVSYEEDLINLVKMLVSSGIEPMRERRMGGPLVIAGGPVISSNPLPFFPLADVLAPGEGEVTLPLILEAAADAGTDRSALAERLSNVDGIILPGFSERTPAAAPADSGLFQSSAILASDTVFPDMLLVEISRGCPGACLFCMARSIYRPFRTMPFGRFESLVDSAAGRGMTPPRVGLVSTAVAAHPGFIDMMDLVHERGGSVGLSSLRAMDVDDATAAAIGRSRIKSISLAPETGSEGMRVRLGKKVHDQAFFNAARLLRGSGVSRFTLYMLAGLPGEDRRTFDESERFLRAFAEAAGGASVTVNLNALVPKPGTPLQFIGMTGQKELGASIESMKGACSAAGVGISVKGTRSSMNQARIALGGRAVGRAAVRFAAGRTSWKKALKDEGVDPGFIHSERGLIGPLPWEDVLFDSGRDALLIRYRAYFSRPDRSC